MKAMMMVIATLFSVAANATDTPEQAAQFKELRAACSKLKSYSAFKKEVIGNYDKVAPTVLGGYIPADRGPKGNGATLMINPKKWDEMSPKYQVEITNAAYMIEVCAPDATTLPVIVIVDWKSYKPLATRRGFRITPWVL